MTRGTDWKGANQGMPILGSSTGQVLFRHQHAIPACRVQGIVVDMLHETDELAYVRDPRQRDRCRVSTYLESYFSPDPAQTPWVP